MIWRTFLRQRLPTALCPERGDHGGSELYWYRQMWRSAKFVEGFTQYSVQFSSVTQSCLTLCNPMNLSTPGLPVYHQLPGFTQTHVHWVSDAIQSSHLLSSPSPPALNLSQQQGLFKWVSSLHQVAKVLEFQLQHQSFQWTPRTDLLQNGLVGSPCSPRDSQESSPTLQSKASILRHSAFLIHQLSHPYMTTGKTIALSTWTIVGKVTSLLFNMLSRLFNGV